MKKTFLSIVAMGFGVSVAFAQATPAETGAPVSQEQTTEAVAQDEQDRNKVEMAAIPSAAQDAFKNSAYSDMEVLAVYEVAPESGTEAKVYEFEIAEKAEGANSQEMDGVELEKVSERQPDMILHIDEKGQLIKEENPDQEEGQ